MLRRTRPGFTMVEVVVVMAIVSALVAVIALQVVGRVKDGKSGALAQTMASLGEAITAYRTDVRRYPTHLEYLSVKPPSTAQDLCGRTLPTHLRDRWRGPYVQRAIDSGGARVSDATVRSALVKKPATFASDTAGVLLIETQDVDSTVADGLERALDATYSDTLGTIRWAAGAEAGRVTLSYAVPVRGC